MDSSSLSLLNVAKVYDPRVDIRQNLIQDGIKFMVEAPSQYIQYFQVDASTASNNNISFTNLSWDPNQALGRFMYLAIPVRFTLLFTGDQTVLLNNSTGIYAPKNTFLRAVTTTSVKLNNTTLNETPNQYISALQYYGYKVEDAPTDYSYSFNRVLDTQSLYTASNGSSNNPLGLYEDGTLLGQQPRGGYKDVLWRVQAAAAFDGGSNTTTMVVDVLFNETFDLAPFNFGEHDQKGGICGIQNLTIQLTVNPLVQLLWANGSGAPVLPTSTVSIGVANSYGIKPVLHYQLYTIPMSITDMPMRQKMIYQRNSTQVVQKSIASAVAVQTGGSFLSDAIIPISVPKYIYVFLGESDNNIKCEQCNSWVSITDLQITFGNKQNVFSNLISQNQLSAGAGPASAHFNIELYKLICLKNGIKMNLPQFAAHTGSVICIDVAEDCQLDPYEAAGMFNNSSFQVRGNYWNQLGYPVADLQLTIVFINEGLLYYNGDLSFTQIMNVTSRDMLASVNIIDSQHYYYMKDNENYLGGLSLKSITDAAKSALRTVGSVAQKALPYVQKGVEYAAKAAPVLAGLGYVAGGMDTARQPMSQIMGSGRDPVQTAMDHRRQLTGGAIASKASIHDKIMKYETRR